MKGSDHVSLVVIVGTIALGLFAAGCSGSTGSEPTQVPLILPNDATPTALAAEPAAATPPPRSSYYNPPGWDGVSDVNCKAFDTKEHAQSFFLGTLGSTTNDPYGLDGDHDGRACETLP